MAGRESRDDAGDVLIVAANTWAYDCFWQYSAYICQAGRRFRPHVDRLGYYANGAIQREIPIILARRDQVALTPQTVRDLRSSGDPIDARFATIVEQAIVDPHPGPVEQIFLLSSPNDPRTLHLAHPIHNTERTQSGRRIAWTQGHRYVPESALLTNPATTSELTVRVSERTPGGAGS